MDAPTSFSPPQQNRRGPSRPLLLLLGIGALGLLLWTLLGTDAADAVTNEFYEVKRDDFLISIVEGGNITAVSEISVRNEVEGQSARIIYIIPEGSYVQKGDLLVELDSAAAEDQVNQQLIAFEKAQFALIQAQEQLAIQESQASSDIRAAEIKLEIAEIDLNKFLEGEKEQKRRELELEIQTIEEKLGVDQDRLKWTVELFDQGFEQKSKLDQDKLTVSSTLKSLEQATNALWMFLQFDLNKSLVDFRSKVEEAEKELERVKHQAKAKLSQFEAEVKTAESTLELNRSKLDRDQKNLKNCKIHAPADGLVVYPVGDSRWSNESMIEEGATVRNRQELIKLPDTSRMKLVIKVHESHVGKVKVGMPAYVVMDPMPDQRFLGTVSKVALLPDTSSRWGNPDLKLYNTEILIKDTLPDAVKPGVSARAEIIITNLQDVLRVPVQAVTTLKGKPVVYVAGNPPKSVPVEVGMFNTKFIQVVSGLSEGDQVLLAPPLDSASSDLEGTIMTDGESIPTNTPPANLPQTLSTEEFTGGPGPRGGLGGPGQGGAGGEGGEARAGGFRERDSGGAGSGGGSFNREEMMKRFDTNGDGNIDETERAAMREAFQQMRGAGGGRPDGGAGGGDRPRRRPEGGNGESGGRGPGGGAPDGGASPRPQN